ncbi:hypothetical protein AB8Q38_22915, partial [Klebsiella quasipneumoniae]|uniref:hypothetical protein n=1 Tax=Klebsiella quasipneumoniae TaxID=1463165 RepID=UPI0038D186F2
YSELTEYVAIIRTSYFLFCTVTEALHNYRYSPSLTDIKQVAQWQNHPRGGLFLYRQSNR